MRTRLTKKLLWLVILNLGLAGLGVATRSARAEQAPMRDCCKPSTEGDQHCCVNCCFGWFSSCVSSASCNL